MEIPSEMPELDYVSIANLVKKEKLLDWLDQMIVVVQKNFRYTNKPALLDVEFSYSEIVHFWHFSRLVSHLDFPILAFSINFCPI